MNGDVILNATFSFVVELLYLASLFLRSLLQEYKAGKKDPKELKLFYVSYL